MTELRELMPEYPISKNTTLDTVERESFGLRDNDWLKVASFVNNAFERGYDYDDQLEDIYSNDPQILKNI